MSLEARSPTLTGFLRLDFCWRLNAGQSKWVAERLLLEARRRGVPVNVVRPGYIVGSSLTGGMRRLPKHLGLWIAESDNEARAR